MRLCGGESRRRGGRSVWLRSVSSPSKRERGGSFSFPFALKPLKYLISHPPTSAWPKLLPPFDLRPQPPPGPARPFSASQAPFQGQLDTSNLRPPWQPRDWSLSNALKPIDSDRHVPEDDWKTHLLPSASPWHRFGGVRSPPWWIFNVRDP